MKIDQVKVGLRVRVARPSPDALSLRGRVGTVVAVEPYLRYAVRVRFDDGHEASVRPQEIEPAQESRKQACGPRRFSGDSRIAPQGSAPAVGPGNAQEMRVGMGG